MGKQAPEKSSQPSSWRTYHLNEVYDFASGLSKNRKEFGFGFPFLSFKEVFNSYFLPKMLASLANTTDVERQRCSVKRGDAFLTRTSETQEELGMSSVALVDYPNATFNGFTKRLRPNGLVEAHPEYVGYYFRSPIFRATITSMASMTTRASLNNEMLAALKIVLPPLSEQKAIAQVLSSLDDKIDLLHRQNKTLEAIAETLFHQWFVAEVQDDWIEGSLSDVACFRSGKSRPKDTGNGLIPIYGGNGVLDYASVFNAEGMPIIVGRVGAYCGSVYIENRPVWITDNALSVESKDATHTAYVYFLLKSLNLNQMAQGSSHPLLTQTLLKEIEIVVPHSKIVNAFCDIANETLKRAFFNKNQVQILEKLRDALLPKLMGGEVRVNTNALTKAS